MPERSFIHDAGSQVPKTEFTMADANDRLAGHIRIVGPSFEPRVVTVSAQDGKTISTELHPAGTTTGTISNAGNLVFADGAEVWYDSATDQAVAAGPASATVCKMGVAVGDTAATDARVLLRFTG